MDEQVRCSDKIDLCLRSARVVLLMSGCAHQSGQADAAQTEKELRTLQDEWAVARIKGDVDFLERFYAQDLRLQVMDGSVVERKDDIAMFDRIRRGDQDTIKPESIRTWT